MKNPNWIKQLSLAAAERPDIRPLESPSPARPLTQDDLDAYRFGTKPIRRPAVAVAREPHSAGADSPGSAPSPASPNECIPATPTVPHDGQS
jgi:hypothetical protein